MTVGKIRLDLVTPTRVVAAGEYDMIRAPSVEGEFGVLPGHTPLLALLKPGLVVAARGEERHAFAVKSGVAEIEPATMIILTENALPAAEIDEKETRELLAKAEAKARETLPALDSLEHKLLQEELDWCAAKLAAVTESRK